MADDLYSGRQDDQFPGKLVRPVAEVERDLEALGWPPEGVKTGPPYGPEPTPEQLAALEELQRLRQSRTSTAFEDATLEVEKWVTRWFKRETALDEKEHAVPLAVIEDDFAESGLPLTHGGGKYQTAVRSTVNTAIARLIRTWEGRGWGAYVEGTFVGKRRVRNLLRPRLEADPRTPDGEEFYWGTKQVNVSPWRGPAYRFRRLARNGVGLETGKLRDRQHVLWVRPGEVTDAYLQYQRLTRELKTAKLKAGARDYRRLDTSFRIPE